jgi:hypothetical protein
MREAAFRSTAIVFALLAVSSCDPAGNSGDASPGSLETSSHEFDEELGHGPRTANELRDTVLSVATVAHDDTRLSRHRGVLLFEGAPFTGRQEKRAANDRVVGLTNYLDGRAEGWSLSWFESGKIRERRFWKAGRKHDIHLGWWENGEPRLELRFVDGEFEGVCREWHVSGQLASMRSYRGGMEDGPQQSWAADGSLVANYVVRGGRRYGTIGSRPCFTVTDGAQNRKQTETP